LINLDKTQQTLTIKYILLSSFKNFWLPTGHKTYWNFMTITNSDVQISLLSIGLKTPKSKWTQHKIEPKNIQIGQNFTWKWSRSQKFVWQLPDGICSRGQKWKITSVRSNSSVIQKDLWNLSKACGQNFLL
jgi:hypothetical protein